MVHNYIIIYIGNWQRILGKWDVQILNILSIHLPDKEITNIYKSLDQRMQMAH